MSTQSIYKVNKETLKVRADNILIDKARNNYTMQYFLLSNCTNKHKSKEALLLSDMLDRDICENNYKIKLKYETMQ